MPLQKLQFKPGVNRELTRYSAGASWYDCDKIRFRYGFPEKIGGWERISGNTFSGVCRSLWAWVTLGGIKLVGVGTHLKFYLERGGFYDDITPIRATTTNAATFAATNGSTTITVTDSSHGASVGDFVTFSSAVSLGGNITASVLNAEHQIVAVTSGNTYTFTSSVAANSSDSGNGGSATDAAYQISVGLSIEVPVTGFGAGTWGESTFGYGGTGTTPLRLWSQSNFGEDLVFGPRGGGAYYWDATNGTTTRGVALSSLGGASNVPTIQNFIFVSDIHRFVFCFGTNPVGGSAQDPLLLRWSDREDPANWTPSATNESGSLVLSQGTEIITAHQGNQAINVWTDSSLYSLQFLGGQAVWGAQLVGTNVSIVSPNAAVFSNGVSYWMGKDKFYMYDGRIQPIQCDLLRHVVDDINRTQTDQIFAGTNEEFSEVWWFYCSSGSNTIDRYVIYNYKDKIWYHGTLARTAWLDSGIRDFPLAATYSYNLVDHELGVDDGESNPPVAINAHITSSEFDLQNGDNFGFIRRVLPDMTFSGSTADSPSATMTFYPLKSPGSGYTTPASEGGDSSASVTRSVAAPVEAFTDQINVRVRGRQMALKIESTSTGVQWQLGSPRVDVRPDGRR